MSEVVKSGEWIVVVSRIFALVQHAESLHIASMVRTAFAYVVGDHAETPAKVKFYAAIAANHLAGSRSAPGAFAGSVELEAKAVTGEDRSEAFDAGAEELFGLRTP